MKGFLLGMVATLLLSTYFFTPIASWLPAFPWPVFSHPKPALAPPPSLATVKGVNVLGSTVVHIIDSIEGENNHYKVKYSLHGEAILGIDLSKVAYVQVDQQRMEAVLSLPTPHVIQHKVDHERSEEIYLKSVSWFAFSDPQLLRCEVFQMGDRKIKELAQAPGYTERAKVQSERALQDLFQRVGWKVSFEWKDDLPPAKSTNPAA